MNPSRPKDRATYMFMAKSTAHTYCEDFQDFIASNYDVVKEYIRPSRGNTHGIRKGAASESTSGSTVPPPCTAVALRGEWSIGKIFDIYFQNITGSAGGDQYLGRVLCGLDPLSTDFTSMPPHFTCDTSNDDIKEAMSLTFGSLIESNPDLEQLPGVLLILLASLVYHSTWMLGIAGDSTTHPFNNIALLNDAALLEKLRPLVSIQTGPKMPRATGIPPHIGLSVQLRDAMHGIYTIIEEIKRVPTVIAKCVSSAFDEYDRTNQIPSLSVVNAAVEERMSSVNLQLTRLTQLMEAQHGSTASTNQPTTVPAVNTHIGLTHTWGGRFWDVPESFRFPSPTRRNGWAMWIYGLPNRCIKPFRDIKAGMLPNPLSGFEFTKGPAAYQGEYEKVAMHNFKPMFRNKTTGAIQYFDGTWKLASSNDTSEGAWAYWNSNESGRCPPLTKTWKKRDGSTFAAFKCKLVRSASVVFQEQWMPIYRLMEKGASLPLVATELGRAERLQTSYEE